MIPMTRVYQSNILVFMFIRSNQQILYKVLNWSTIVRCLKLRGSTNCGLFLQLFFLNSNFLPLFLRCDQSLHCKAHLLIPIYDGSPEPNLPICSASSTQSKTTLAPISASTSKSGDANSIDESEHDSLDKIFKRIDLNVRHTKMSVKRLDKLSRYEFESWFFIFYRRARFHIKIIPIKSIYWLTNTKLKNKTRCYCVLTLQQKYQLTRPTSRWFDTFVVTVDSRW